MRFKPEQYKNMFFQINGLKDIHDLTNLGQLKIGQMPKALRDHFVRYHLLMYDKGSPFVEHIAKLDRRQNAVLEEIEIDQKRWSAEIEQIKELRHPCQQDLIMSILMAQNDPFFNQLIIEESVHYQILKEVSAPMPTEVSTTKIIADRSGLLKQANDILERIDSMRNKIYLTVDQLEQKKLRIPISPETLSRLLG